MTTFDERERAFEKRFAQDEELKFKAMARRNRLAGLWAAKKLGLAEALAERYAKELVIADLDAAGSDCVCERIHTDLAKKGITESKEDIQRVIDEFMVQAQKEVAVGS